MAGVDVKPGKTKVFALFITFSKGGAIKMTKEKPALARGHRAVRLTVRINESVFDEPPILDAELVVPHGALEWPTLADAVDVEVWGEH
jgi:hypothetical protein